MQRCSIQQERFATEDIRRIAEIHRAEIARGFLSSLGPGAIELILSVAAESDAGVLLAARVPTADDAICGFALGTTDTSRLYKDFVRTKLGYAVWLLAPRILSLDKLRKTLETLLYPAKQPRHRLPSAELLDIAVCRDYQGTGLAQCLFHQFCDVLRRRGVSEIKITTGKGLVRAQRFYEGLGALRVGSLEVHRGQETLVYTYAIPPRASSDRSVRE